MKSQSSVPRRLTSTTTPKHSVVNVESVRLADTLQLNQQNLITVTDKINIEFFTINMS